LACSNGQRKFSLVVFPSTFSASPLIVAVALKKNCMVG
jgi:hypothetical protein